MIPIDRSLMNIQVVGQNSLNVDTFSRMFAIDKLNIRSVDRNKYVQDSIVYGMTELLVIDLDACGITDTSFLIFLATSFTPATPIVLITGKPLAASLRNRYLSAGAQAVIQLNDSSKTAVMVA